MTHYAEDDRWFEQNRQVCAICKTKPGDILSGAWLCFECALAIQVCAICVSKFD